MAAIGIRPGPAPSAEAPRPQPERPSPDQRDLAPASSGAGPGPLVPAYAIVGGRTRSTAGDLPLEAIVTTTDDGRVAEPTLRFEHAAIVHAARQPMAVIELAHHLAVPLGVARVLVSDLASQGLLTTHSAPVGNDQGPSIDVLERLLSGLRAR